MKKIIKKTFLILFLILLAGKAYAYKPEENDEFGNNHQVCQQCILKNRTDQFLKKDSYALLVENEEEIEKNDKNSEKDIINNTRPLSTNENEDNYFKNNISNTNISFFKNIFTSTFNHLRNIDLPFIYTNLIGGKADDDSKKILLNSGLVTIHFSLEYVLPLILKGGFTTDITIKFMNKTTSYMAKYLEIKNIYDTPYKFYNLYKSNLKSEEEKLIETIETNYYNYIKDTVTKLSGNKNLGEVVSSIIKKSDSIYELYNIIQQRAH